MFLRENENHMGVYLMAFVSMAMSIPLLFYAKNISDSLQDIAKATRKEANS